MDDHAEEMDGGDVAVESDDEVHTHRHTKQISFVYVFFRSLFSFRFLYLRDVLIRRRTLPCSMPRRRRWPVLLRPVQPLTPRPPL